MGLSSEDRQRIEEEEKFRVEVRQKQQRRQLGYGCLGALILFFLVVVCVSAITLGGDSGPNNVDSSTSVSIGQNGILYDGVPDGSIPVAINEDAFNEFNQAIVAKDSYGIGLMIMSGQVFKVPSKTKVLVIDRSLFRSRIRILEGPYQGSSGWVPYEWVTHDAN